MYVCVRDCVCVCERECVRVCTMRGCVRVQLVAPHLPVHLPAKAVDLERRLGGVHRGEEDVELGGEGACEKWGRWVG